MKLCFFQGKIYQSPKVINSNGREIYLFSIGINNNYKDKNGEIVKRPMTFINFSSVDKKHYEKLMNSQLKEDTISIVARLDIVDMEEEGRRVTRYYFNALNLSVNNKDFYNNVVSLIYDKDKGEKKVGTKDNNSGKNTDEYVPEVPKVDDGLPF